MVLLVKNQLENYKSTKTWTLLHDRYPYCLKTIPLLMMLRYFAGSGIFCLTKTISSICRVHKVAVNMQIDKNSTEKSLLLFTHSCESAKASPKNALALKYQAKIHLAVPKCFFLQELLVPFCTYIVCQNCVQFVWLADEQVFSEQKMRNDEYNHI